MARLAFLPSPASNGFHLGPLFVHAYGMAYLVAVLVAVAIVRRRWAKRGGDRTLVEEVALVGFPAGLIGGRLYFLATSWSEVPHDWWGPLAIWQGGLGIWGGIAGGTLGGLWVLRRRGVDIPVFLDAAAPALLVAQAIGRVGNYFNQELFGGPTTLPWGLEIDPAHRPAAYAHYATFHPTFLYELIWNLALAGALVALGRRRSVRPPGLFALYVAGYSGFRIFEETLRVDPAHHLFGLRLNFFVASLLFVAGLTWFFRTQRPGRRAIRRGATLFATGLLVCAAAGCGQGGSASAHPSADSSTSTQPRVLSVNYGRFRPTGAPHAYLALKVRTRDPDGQVVGFGWERLSPRGHATPAGQVDGGCGLAAKRNGAVGTWYLPMQLERGSYRFRFELSSSSCDVARVVQTARQVVRFRAS